ncbi:MAG: CrcB family protein [Bifidobacteriaceae bacterium]|jgi:CrcB protein|nr:CrcB family protein [Bifidobacteriaceae bacterium]
MGWQQFALVAAGGAAGTLARWGLSVAAYPGSAAWPWVTFAINLAGSFALGFLYGWTTRRGDVRWRLLLGVGLLGGFTTYSAFSVEVITLAMADAVFSAAAYALTSVLGGLAVAWFGLALGRRLVRGTP